MVLGQARKKAKLLSVLSAMIVIFAMMAGVSTNDVNATGSQRIKAMTTMSDMRSIKWIACEDLTIYGNDYLYGIEYTGIPYNQDPRLTTTQSFVNSLEYWEGHLYLYARNSGLGNDCSSAVALSWRTGGSSIICSQVDTWQMRNAVQSSTNCMAKRGTYSSGYSFTDTMVAHSTKVQLYNSLVAGDACFYRLSDGGHAILITGVNVSTQTVTYIEQIGAGSGGSRLTNYHTTWTSGTKTFEQLTLDYYVSIKPTDI